MPLLQHAADDILNFGAPMEVDDHALMPVLRSQRKKNTSMDAFMFDRTHRRTDAWCLDRAIPPVHTDRMEGQTSAFQLSQIKARVHTT